MCNTVDHFIRESSNIKGIAVCNKEVKLSQYANNTIIHLNGDKESFLFQACTGVLTAFEYFSIMKDWNTGFMVEKINMKKDVVIPLSSLKN